MSIDTTMGPIRWTDALIEDVSCIEFDLAAKTNAEDDFERYFDVIDKMLDFDILTAINSTILFMNSCSDKFVEFEQTR